MRQIFTLHQCEEESNECVHAGDLSPFHAFRVLLLRVYSCLHLDGLSTSISVINIIRHGQRPGFQVILDTVKLTVNINIKLLFLHIVWNDESP